MEIYFKDTGEQRPNLKGKGGTKTILSLCSPLNPQGNKGTGYPWECAGSKGKFGFIIRTAKALASLHI